MGWVYTTGMVIQDGIRLVRFHTRALLPSFASQNPPPSVGRLSVTYAFVIKSLDWNLSVSLGFLPPSAGWLSKPSPVGEGVGEADG